MHGATVGGKKTFVIVTLALLFTENIATVPLLTATNYDLNSV